MTKEQFEKLYTEAEGLAKNRGLFLERREERIILSDSEKEIGVSFDDMKKRLKHNNLTHELLVKAAKPAALEAPLTAVDATAGLGEDAILLAAAGFEVTMYERDPVMAVMLYDAVLRALDDPQTKSAAGRMHVEFGDSIEALENMREKPQIVMLDPMFPERKKSGLVKKKFQLLHSLENPCEEEAQMLSAALLAASKRVIVKRPAKGPYLAERKPDYSLDGKAVRVDVYIKRASIAGSS